jgi:hypothetical protein
MRPFQRQAKALRQMFAGAASLFAGILWLGFDLYPPAVGIAATALGAAGLLLGVIKR